MRFGLWLSVSAFLVGLGPCLCWAQHSLGNLPGTGKLIVPRNEKFVIASSRDLARKTSQVDIITSHPDLLRNVVTFADTARASEIGLSPDDRWLIVFIEFRNELSELRAYSTEKLLQGVNEPIIIYRAPAPEPGYLPDLTFFAGLNDRLYFVVGSIFPTDRGLHRFSLDTQMDTLLIAADQFTIVTPSLEQTLYPANAFNMIILDHDRPRIFNTAAEEFILDSYLQGAEAVQPVLGAAENLFQIYKRQMRYLLDPSKPELVPIGPTLSPIFFQAIGFDDYVHFPGFSFILGPHYIYNRKEGRVSQLVDFSADGFSDAGNIMYGGHRRDVGEVVHYDLFTKVDSESLEDLSTPSFAACLDRPLVVGSEQFVCRTARNEQTEFIKKSFDGRSSETLGVFPGSDRSIVRYALRKKTGDLIFTLADPSDEVSKVYRLSLKMQARHK